MAAVVKNKALPDDTDALKALIVKERAERQKEVHCLRQQLNTLIEALQLERQRLYGARSEKSPAQGELLFDEAEQESEAAEPDEGASAESTTVTARARRSVRKPLPAELPRVRQVHELSSEQRVCSCGCTLSEIGEDTSEQLDIIPAKVQVIVHVRKKYACHSCEETIKSAPRPPVLLPKSIASANTMAYVITSKYADGLPLYRLSGILKRYGIDMSRQTLSESVLRCADQLEPFLALLNEALMRSSVLYMDETPVQVLNEPGKSAQSKSYMWVQRGGPPDQNVVLFTYDPSRSTAVPDKLLSGYTGVLMSDGYQPYRTVAAMRQLVHLCCWAHARRKFKEAQRVQAKGKSGKADMGLDLIAKLYAVERKNALNDVATRHQARQKEALPVLQQLQAWLEKTSLQVPPKSAIGKAVNYTLKYWPELSRYTENGAWPIDNNVAENAIRPFVIGRKSWLFSNSQRGAKASAALYSLIETAKANQQEPYHYLSWLFSRLPVTPADQLDQLLPWNMTA